MLTAGLLVPMGQIGAITANAVTPNTVARKAMTPNAETATGSAAASPGVADSGRTRRAPRPIAGTAAAPLALEVSAVNPAVATPGKPVNVVVSVSNTAATPTNGPVEVSLGLGSAGALITRTQVRAFAEKPAPTDRIVGRTMTPTPIPAKAALTVNIWIPGSAIPSPRPFGVLPLALQARVVSAEADTTPSTSPPTSGASPATSTPTAPGASVIATHASFLPFQTRKEYQPLDIAIVAPLTLDPDPALVNATSADRRAAWERAIGPGSRIERILDATQDETVTWAVDPAILGLSPKDSAGDPGPRAPTATPSAQAARSGASSAAPSGSALHPAVSA
ncbi:MAG: hypothetical protein Q4P32_10955, partial [Micrococcales bacterium]|nr:hypothetical protein [Micrococcales bacterium]